MSESKQNPEKVVDMPNKEELLKMLPKGTLGVSTQTDRFYSKFLDYVSGSPIVGPGVNMAWELAGFDTLQNYPMVIKFAVDMNYNRVVDAIISDPEVAKSAKDFRQRVLEELQKEDRSTNI